MRADRYYPGFKGQMKWGLEDVEQYGIPLDKGRIWYVDGDKSTGGAGGSWADAYSTVQDAIDAASAFDVILIAPKLITDYTGDPTSYTENLVIPADKPHLSLIGISRGRTQGGLPQMKVGTTTTDPLLKVRAAGCLIQNLGFNGSGGTGGGILLDDDYATKTAFGTTIRNCHMKNCVGTTATNALTGGAIMWTSAGNAWQVTIEGNHFYKNVGDIVVKGTTNTRPQDIVIRGNTFQAAVTSACDVNIITGGSGFQTVIINDNIFTDLPALGSATTARYFDLTGTLGGMVCNNVFGCLGNATATELTFKAAGTAAFLPTTVLFVNNWGVSANAGETAYHTIA
ncbi:MAG: right-handed parallel beta-helix repeat-containing protein [Planctomycetota bacterium]|jgi:hypothetical protein